MGEEREKEKTKPSAADDPMGWQSYVVPVVGSAVVSSLAFLLGKGNYSFVWILIIIALNLAKSHLWKKREQRLMALRATSLREREVILAQLQDLPAWVQFPDTERVEWLNKVIHQLWPYVGEYGKTFMHDFIIPQVKAQMPGMFKNFKFTKMDMGDIPCRVGGIKVYTSNVGRDRIIVDMDVAYAGDADFSVSCCGFTGGMNNIVFSGKLRAVCKPLLPYPPMIGGVAGSFLEMPRIDFNLTGMGEMVELPGLIDAIRSVMNSQVAALCVLPNEIVVPLAPDVDVTKLYFPEPDGVVRIKIIEARNLENKDISLLTKGKSDPYCEIQVGSQFFKTRTIDNDLNPIWNEVFEAVVDQAHGQKLRIELFDEDQGKDEELGRLSIDLRTIQARGSVDKWFPLEGCKHGDLHLKATWMKLSSESAHLEKQEWEAEWNQTDRSIHPALLMVFVDSVSDLPYPKSKLEPSPFVEVSLGKESQRTPVKVKTVNPLYQSKFLFFIRHIEGQELKFEAFDDGTRRSLGILTLPLNSLLKEPHLEVNQQMFYLTHGVHQSPIVVTVRIRGLAPSDGEFDLLTHLRHEAHKMKLENLARARNANGLVKNDVMPRHGDELDHDILGEYGNAQHIERRQNGDVVAVEPAKTVDQDAGPLDVEIKLNSNHLHLDRNDSNSSFAETRSPSRLGRIFRSKHEMRKDEIRATDDRGELEMSVQFVTESNKLIVKILQARHLKSIDKKGTCNPYCSIKLIAIDTGKEIKRKTATLSNTTSPIFDNHIEFDVTHSDLLNYRLAIILKDDTNYGAFATKPVIGCIDFRLDSLNNFELPRMWIALQAEKRK